MAVRKTAAKPLKGIRAVGKSLPVGEIAYTSLKEAIVRGDLHPGQRLVESTLSAQMMISRIPVREAIKKLEQDDLVEKREKGGFIVKNPSREEIEETFGIRAVLEGYAAALAARHLDQAILKRLEETLEGYRDALDHGDIATMTQLNNKLDDIIFTASANKRLRVLIGNFRDFISRYRKVLLTRLDYAAMSLADHEKIVNAMKDGEPEKVEQLMRRHLIRGKEILIRDMDAGVKF
jgi:DNA-binding GntR family transcriptional regulator